MANGSLPPDIVTSAEEDCIYVDVLGGENGVGLGIHGFVLHFGLILVTALAVTTGGLGVFEPWLDCRASWACWLPFIL